jgi:hypothetical protein
MGAALCAKRLGPLRQMAHFCALMTHFCATLSHPGENAV